MLRPVFRWLHNVTNIKYFFYLLFHVCMSRSDKTSYEVFFYCICMSLSSVLSSSQTHLRDEPQHKPCFIKSKIPKVKLCTKTVHKNFYLGTSFGTWKLKNRHSLNLIHAKRRTEIHARLGPALLNFLSIFLELQKLV